MIGYFISFLVLMSGILVADPLLVNVAVIIFLISYLIPSFLSGSIQDKINPIILCCIGKLMCSIGNILGIYYKDDPIQKLKYWYYANENYLFESSLIHLCGTLFIILGYIVMTRINQQKVIPILNFHLREEWFLKYDKLILLLIILGVTKNLPFPFSDEYLRLFFSLFVFIFAYLSQKENRSNHYYIRAYALVILLTIDAYYNSYLRIETVNPSILLILGLVWGSGGIKPLMNKTMIPLFLFLFLFALSFDKLGGDNRADAEKKNIVLKNSILRLVGIDEEEEEKPATIYVNDETQKEQPIWARMSNFNQISKLVEVQNEDGFSNGKELLYLTYAWIPRVFWPEKPPISAGRSFAARASLAYVNEQGQANNSVDMTHAGELYLNFGYIGSIIGCFILGALVSLFWQASNFFAELNITGIMFGGYLLNLGYWQFGADLQIVITLFSVYATIVVTDRVFNMIIK